MRNNSLLRVAIAFLITPVFSVLIIPTAICMFRLVTTGSCDVHFNWTLPILGVAFGATALVGLPLYLLLARHNMQRFWSFGLVGVLVALLAVVILKSIDSGFSGYGLVVVFSPIGFVSGALFWLIVAPKVR